MPLGSSELLQGTLQVLILKALYAEPAHGYGIARWIEATTNDVLRVEEGSLYPALRRLETRATSPRSGDSPRTIAARSSMR